MRQEFIVAENEEMGGIGLAPISHTAAFGALGYAPGLAHDFLEHAGEFTIPGEIKALAAMYHIRYEAGWTSLDGMHHIEVSHIASEWTNLYHGLCQEHDLGDAPYVDKLDPEIERDLSLIVSLGKREILDENKGWLDLDAYKALSLHFANWFRVGYRAAQERFSKLNASRVLDIFNQATISFQEILDDDIESKIGTIYVAELNLETGHLDIFRE